MQLRAERAEARAQEQRINPSYIPDKAQLEEDERELIPVVPRLQPLRYLAEKLWELKLQHPSQGTLQTALSMHCLAGQREGGLTPVERDRSQSAAEHRDYTRENEGAAGAAASPQRVASIAPLPAHLLSTSGIENATSLTTFDSLEFSANTTLGANTTLAANTTVNSNSPSAQTRTPTPTALSDKENEADLSWASSQSGPIQRDDPRLKLPLMGSPDATKRDERLRRLQARGAIKKQAAASHTINS